MHEEYNSVLSTPAEANFISHFGRYWYKYRWNPIIGPMYQPG